MLRQGVTLPVSYFQHEDALQLYFVEEPWPGMTESTLPCGSCTNQRGMINLDCSKDDVLVSLEVLDVRSVFPRDFVAMIPIHRSVSAPIPHVEVPIAYFPWTDEARFTFHPGHVRVAEKAVCGEWDEVGRDIRLEFDPDGRFVRLWIAKASVRLAPWLQEQLPVAGDFAARQET